MKEIEKEEQNQYCYSPRICRLMVHPLQIGYFLACRIEAVERKWYIQERQRYIQQLECSTVTKYTTRKRERKRKEERRNAVKREEEQNWLQFSTRSSSAGVFIAERKYRVVVVMDA